MKADKRHFRFSKYIQNRKNAQRTDSPRKFQILAASLPPVFGQGKNHTCHLTIILRPRRDTVSFQVPVIDSILYRTYPRAIPFSPINFFRAEFPHNVGTDMVCPFFTAGFAQYPISVPIYKVANRSIRNSARTYLRSGRKPDTPRNWLRLPGSRPAGGKARGRM